MWLTKNEKKILGLLLDNSRISDTSLAERVGISSQAIGRIRRQLEEDMIKEYSLKLDNKELGIELFAMLIVSLEKAKPEVEKKIIEFKNTISFFKTLRGKEEYVLVLGFKDIEEMNNTLNPSPQNKEAVSNFLAVKEIIPFCHSNILKDSSKDIWVNAINHVGVKSVKFFQNDKTDYNKI